MTRDDENTYKEIRSVRKSKAVGDHGFVSSLATDADEV